MLVSDEEVSPDPNNLGNPELLEISLDKSTERLNPDQSKDYGLEEEEDPFQLRRMSKLRQPDLSKYLSRPA